MTRICLEDRIPGFNDIRNDSTTSELFTKTISQGFRIIRYKKHWLTSDLVNSYGLFRSMIINSNNHIVCFSPPKSLSIDDFTKKYPKPNDTIIAQEFIEGTMINVFWSDAWTIATRGTIGATYGFYNNNKTFRDMFFEAAANHKLDMDQLDRSKCYSFVLQHPDNRIVVPFTEPRLYLVGMYSICNNSEIFAHKLPEGLVMLPKIYGRGISYEELTEKYTSMNTPYMCMGVVIYNTETGERTKIRNPAYEYVRKLRGNQPKLEYHYLCLRKEQNVDEFLKYYPEAKQICMETRNRIHQFTNTLYKNYIACYIRKERPLIEYSKQYRTHMFQLHQHFLTVLKNQNKYIRKYDVVQYVNNLHPSLLLSGITS